MVLDETTDYGNLKGHDFNDRASSICIPPGFKLTVWQDVNYRGDTFTVGRRYFDTIIPNLNESSRNDKVSSLVLDKM